MRLVRDIFSAITARYDFLNHLLSLRRDVAWRRKAASSMRFFKTNRLLDCATGTCDLAIESVLKNHGIQVIGLDLVREMMEVGKNNIEALAMGSHISLMQGDGLRLPFRDGSFDVASIAFGIRNIPDRPGALREMGRVVVPGGQVMVLEMALPESPLFRSIYEIYLEMFLPRVARAFTVRPEAYRYLADSIKRFPSPRVFAGLMEEAGLERVEIHPLTFGITYLHIAYKAKAQDI